MNNDLPTDAQKTLRRLIRLHGSSIPLKSLVTTWIARGQSSQALLEHLRLQLLLGGLGLVRNPEGTHVCLGCKAMDRHYRRRRSDCLSEGEIAEFANAVWSARSTTRGPKDVRVMRENSFAQALDS